MKKKILLIPTLLTPSVLPFISLVGCNKNKQVIHVESVEINDKELALEPDQEISLSCEVLPATATNKSITWTSSDTDVATIDENTGAIQAKAKGKTTITATSNDNPQAIDTFELQVTATGVFEYEYNDTNQTATLTHYDRDKKESDTEVVIPGRILHEGKLYDVTAIGKKDESVPEEAPFYYNKAIQLVVIPNSVTLIGSYAFESCSSLSSITIGNSLSEICFQAFFNVKSLKTICFPPSLTHIAKYCFCWCSAITNTSGPDETPGFRYSGFIADWKKVIRDDPNWHKEVLATLIQCFDGVCGLDETN